jgi:hypothetical protein
MERGGFDKIRIHVLYCASQYVQTYELTRAEAEDIVQKVLEKVAAGGEPTPNEYCGWCKICYKCPPYIRAAEIAAHGIIEDPKFKTWKPGDMDKGPDLSTALQIWRGYVKKWGASVERHALEGSQKKGLTLPGFEQKSRKGKKYIADIHKAFAKAGLPQNEFLDCCAVRIKSSRDYPDKVGVAKKYAALHGMKLATAERKFLESLGDAVKTGRNSVYLKAIKADDNDEEESDE